MKKTNSSIFKKIVCLSLTLCMSLSAFATWGCGNDGSTVQITEKATFTGVHDYTAPDVSGEEYILKDGEFKYALLIPENPTKAIEQAKQEFVLLFKRATGVTISNIVRDGSVTYTEDAKYISFGENKYMQSAGITYDKEQLKESGSRIITKGKSIFLLGGMDIGVITSVYNFMQIYFNYEYYYRNCLEIDTGVKTVKLKNFNVTDVPDIDRAHISHANGSLFDAKRDEDSKAYGETAAEEVLYRKERYRDFNNYGPFMMPIYSEFDNVNSASAGFHNVFEYCPPTDPTTNSNWIADSGTQICFTSHGVEEDLIAMKQHFAKKIENTLKLIPYEVNPYGSVVTITMEDNDELCNCEACMEAYAKDGETRNGAVIRFCNDVMDLVYEWMDQPGNEPYKRDLTCLFFAYSSICKPPAVKNEQTGKWQALPGCEMSEHVGTYFAPNTEFCFYADLYNPVNQRGKDFLEAWLDMTDNFYFWGYGGFHKTSCYYMNNENLFNNDFFRLLASKNCRYFYNEVLDGGDDQTAWNNLKAYISYKLAWNCNLDVDTLTKNYFRAMYKDAADTMISLYKEHRLFFDYTMTANEAVKKNTTFYGLWAEKTIYPYETLKSFLAQIDKALLDIEKYKTTDSDLYDVVRSRIELESVSVLYMILDIHGTKAIPSFDENTKFAYKERLYNVLLKYPKLGSVSNATSLAIDICK